MAVQDLTPQLRTRLSRVERAVGWFVVTSTILLLAGFAYYVYHTAQRKGWFITKLRYHTFVQSAAGLNVGDAVKLMGFNVGQITKIEAMPPFSYSGNVYVEFVIRDPYYGYIWSDSYVKVVSAGLLGNRALEVVQGGTTTNKNLLPSYAIDDKTKNIRGVLNLSTSNYVAYTAESKGYTFPEATEAPVITDRLDALASQAQQALPGIFDLTNRLTSVLTNLNQVLVRAETIVADVQPTLANVAVISGMLTNGQGALGEWVLPTNINRQLQQTLASANTTLITANTNVAMLGANLNLTLENVAGITSNLNAQVQRNDQIVSQISSTIVSADQFVQGLKRHWFLRSAFRGDNSRRNAPPPRPTPSPAQPTTSTPGTSAGAVAPGQAEATSPQPAPPPRPVAGPKAGKRIPPGAAR
jgi:ABC-type transporter Mla subunit MlaD